MWHNGWRNLVLISQQNPPQLVEGTMLLLALAFCGAWFLTQNLFYLILCLSYITGAIASILVRESVAPSAHTHQIRLTALFSLGLLIAVVSFYAAKTGYLGHYFSL